MRRPGSNRDGERGSAVILFVGLVVAVAVAVAASMMIGRPQFAVQQSTGTGFDLTALRKAVEAHALVAGGGTAVCPDTKNPANGVTVDCTGITNGVVPWRTIGVTERQATDAWGQHVWLIRADKPVLTLQSYRGGKRTNCDFILVSGGPDRARNALVGNLFDVRDAASGQDLDIAVCGKIVAAGFGGGGGNKLRFESTKPPENDPDSKVVSPFIGSNPALGEGTVIVMGETVEEGEDIGKIKMYAPEHTSCSWTRPSLDFTTQTLRVFFRLRFIPGETGVDPQGTGAGLTLTVLPGNQDTSDPTEDADASQGVLCGTAQHLGYAGGGATGIPLPKMAVEFDIYDDGEAPARNHVAVLTAWDADTVDHGVGDNPPCGTSSLDGSEQPCTYDVAAVTFLEEADPVLSDDLANAIVGGKAGQEYAVRIEVARRFTEGCTVTKDDGKWMRTKVWIGCDPDAHHEDCDDTTNDFTGPWTKNSINFCHLDPAEVEPRKQVEVDGDYLSYDTVQFGVTFGSYGTATGYILSDVETTVSNAGAP